jgi:CRISPR-associated protein Cmr3
MLKLGAENKAVSYKVLENNSPIEPGDFKKRFKMVITTPAIFDNGWFPGNIDPNTFIYDYNGLKIKLLSAAVGKKLFIGGWDMKNNKPKKMYRAVPAGSVYYFELISGNPEDIIQKFHMKSISDIRPKEGFGITYIGGADD